jgi:excisionase family DNA binding protein
MPEIQLVKLRRGRPPGSRNRQSSATPVPRSPGLEPLTVRAAEAARIVGCGVSKMKGMIADGTVESVKVGTMRLVRVSSLKRLVGE